MSPIKVDKPIKNYLLDFGLTDKEISLYLALLKTGPNTIMNLARETGIKRSTTHNNIEELIKKGLVSQTNYGERRMVVAEDPNKLEFLIEQKKWDMKRLEEALPDVVKTIKDSVPENVAKKVEIKYLEGKDAVLSIFKEVVRAKETKSYANLGKADKYLPENTDLFISRKKEGKLPKMMEIVDPSSETKEKADILARDPNFTYKVSNKSLNLEAVNTIIFEGKVAIINYDTMSATVIKDDNYYLYAVSIFDLLWGLLPENK